MAKSMKEKKDQLPVNISFEEDAGSGFEQTDVESFAVPFLVAMQTNSPQVNEDLPEYIDGAKPGMLFNTVTQELYHAKKKDGKGVNVIPCAFKRQFIEWKPRGHSGGGGGLVAIYEAEEGLRMMKTTEPDPENGKATLPNGNHLSDTRMHYVLMEDANGDWQPIILSMSSTQIKKSRRWVTIMDNIKFTRQDGSKYTPAMYSHVYKVSTIPESNDKGDWQGLDITKVDVVSSSLLYDQAKQFKKLIASGNVEVAQPVDESSNSGQTGKGEAPDI